MIDLTSASRNELRYFFRSFDCVFCDVDGVLWRFDDIIPGAPEALTALKAIGKKIIFVSNNTTQSHEDHYNRLKRAGFGFILEPTDLVVPSVVVDDFLKKRKFTKEIYLIGMSPLRTELENFGFKIEEFNFTNPEESISKYVKAGITVSESVGAVIADLDLNMNRAQFQKAATYLKNPEVLFITGSSNQELWGAPGQTLIGPGVYHKILEDATGRKPHCLAKPGPELNEFIIEKFAIRDLSRVLVIGDSISEDMEFATNCGYQKLLVLSGLTSKKDLDEWKFPEEYKPNYYAQSLKVIQDALSNDE